MQPSGTGINTPAYYKAVNVWCAKNPRQALDKAMAGEEVVATKGCNKSAIINEHLSIAEKLGVNATPMSFVDNGELIPGYYPAPVLIKMVLGDKTH